MDRVFLRFYVHEQHRLHWKPLWEWLLEEGNRMGIAGGSAFRAMAGFGRHRVLHEDRFFELQGSLAIEVEFIATEDEGAAVARAAVAREGARVLRDDSSALRRDRHALGAAGAGAGSVAPRVRCRTSSATRRRA